MAVTVGRNALRTTTFRYLQYHSRSIRQTNGANAVKQEVGILTQDVRDTGDGDFVVVHQHPLEQISTM